MKHTLSATLLLSLALAATVQAVRPDLIVNAASPFINIPILKLALRLHTHYQDLEALMGTDDGKSGMPYAIEHLAFFKAFKRAGRLALFDTGAAPGLTNLLVAEAADALGSLGAVKIRMIEDLISSVIISTWSPTAAIDEIYSRPIIYDRKRFKVIPRFSDPEGFEFPRPFGKKTTYSIMNNEILTIPRHFNLTHMETRSAGSDNESARIMVRLGLLDRKPIHVRGTNLTPLEFIMKIMPPPPTPKTLKTLISKGLMKNGFFALAIEATARRKGKNEKLNYWVRFPSQKELIRRRIYSTYIAYPAGLCAAAFALEVPKIKAAGVFSPEELPKNNRMNILKNISLLGIRWNRR